MLLADPKRILELLGVGASAEPIEKVKAFVEIASRRIEQILETEVELKIRTDFFSTNGLPFKNDLKTPQQLRLSSMFVQGTTTVRRSISGEMLYVDTDGIALLNTDFILDPQRGVVTLVKPINLGHSTLSVTYTAGFEADPAQDNKLGELPGWTEEATTSLAIYLLKILPSTPANRVNGKARVALQNERLVAQYAESLVSPFLRARGHLEFPNRTVANVP